ncbi:Nif3-like dinuclear metal center hexameric protein [Streptococcus minor]|uniref:Nif3-like dinuclear metal center hexameric protein n=1 Tax=Streptococcus minor TaxID=229549 RepID=UPI000363CF7A|nr:Nif3-like dinuclear metal center hexameric protein [Streptococcus minor]
MKKDAIITKTKELYQGKHYLGIEFNEQTSRDQVLYGEEWLSEECTGIVTTCWASVDVIKEAQKIRANLIIVHEALFWNHGDQQDWLQENKTYQLKKELLDEAKITVWRNHDFVHSGILQEDGSAIDGIFLGVVKTLGWEKFVEDLTRFPFIFRFDKGKTLHELSHELIDKLEVNGIRYVGESNQVIRNLIVGYHALGQDNDIIKQLEREDIDAICLLEMVDFTVLEFAKDSLSLGRNKAVLSAGHFNTEEPGMAYMADFLVEKLELEIPIQFVKSGDTVNYIVK